MADLLYPPNVNHIPPKTHGNLKEFFTAIYRRFDYGIILNKKDNKEIIIYKQLIDNGVTVDKIKKFLKTVKTLDVDSVKIKAADAPKKGHTPADKSQVKRVTKEYFKYYFSPNTHKKHPSMKKLQKIYGKMPGDVMNTVYTQIKSFEKTLHKYHKSQTIEHREAIYEELEKYKLSPKVVLHTLQSMGLELEITGSLSRVDFIEGAKIAFDHYFKTGKHITPIEMNDAFKDIPEKYFKIYKRKVEGLEKSVKKFGLRKSKLKHMKYYSIDDGPLSDILSFVASNSPISTIKRLNPTNMYMIKETKEIVIQRKFNQIRKNKEKDYEIIHETNDMLRTEMASGNILPIRLNPQYVNPKIHNHYTVKIKKNFFKIYQNKGKQFIGLRYILQINGKLLFVHMTPIDNRKVTVQIKSKSSDMRLDFNKPVKVKVGKFLRWYHVRGKRILKKKMIIDKDLGRIRFITPKDPLLKTDPQWTKFIPELYDIGELNNFLETIYYKAKRYRDVEGPYINI